MKAQIKQEKETRTEALLREAASALEAAGVKRTPQREILLALLLQKDFHPSAEELEREANKHLPVSTTTVYISLRTLTEAGLIHAVLDKSGRIRYGGWPKPHIHYLCEICQDIADAEATDFPTFFPAAPENWERKEEAPLVVARGYCPRCKNIRG
ncbi:MAG: transcriptional repressor [Nanopusillaceae archaeon]